MANLTLSLDGTLSLFGITRWADGHADTHDATGQRKLKRGNSTNLILRWENMCRRIQLTAAFLYLNRAQKLSGQQAAYVLGFNEQMFHVWRIKYSECAALWGAPEFNTLQRNVKISLAKYMPSKPTQAYAAPRTNPKVPGSVNKKFNPKSLREQSLKDKTAEKREEGKLTSFVKEQLKRAKVLVEENDAVALSAREKRQIKLAVNTLHDLRPDIRLAVMQRVTNSTLHTNN